METHSQRAWTASFVDGIPRVMAGLFSSGSMVFKHWSSVARLQSTVHCTTPINVKTIKVNVQSRVIQKKTIDCKRKSGKHVPNSQSYLITWGTKKDQNCYKKTELDWINDKLRNNEPT